MRLRQIIYYLFLTILLCSCTKKSEEKIFFLGDSIVARWDVKRFFPAHSVENLGVSGEGIKYVESMAHSFCNDIVVVMIGTNDLKWINSEEQDPYVERYVKAIYNLDASTVFLFSILPRSRSTDSENIHQKITSLNKKIQSKVNGTSVVFIDVYEKFYKNGMNSQYSYDGLHLNEYGYELLSESLKTYLW